MLPPLRPSCPRAAAVASAETTRPCRQTPRACASMCRLYGAAAIWGQLGRGHAPCVQHTLSDCFAIGCCFASAPPHTLRGLQRGRHLCCCARSPSPPAPPAFNPHSTVVEHDTCAIYAAPPNPPVNAACHVPHLHSVPQHRQLRQRVVDDLPEERPRAVGQQHAWGSAGRGGGRQGGMTTW